MKTLEITLNSDFSGLTITELLKKWQIPRKERYFLEVEKRLIVNQQLMPFSTILQTGNLVTVFLKEDTQQNLRWGDAQLVERLYEDENLIIVNKACGMKTHGNTADELALQNHVAAYCQMPVFVVHRLDQETSGAVLFAKNSFVLPVLNSLLAERKISREYLALVQGHFTEQNFTLQQRIGRDRHDAKKRIVSASGQEAITQVSVIENFADTTLVSCHLQTGRTHQIRVHLSNIGHPILGDQLYGKNQAKEKRLMLHAVKMTLLLPFTNQKLEVSAPSQSFQERCEQEKNDKD